MGGRFSKKKGGGSEASCSLGPDLQSLDANIHEPNSGFINMVDDGVEVHSLSFDSSKVVTVSALDLGRNVVRVSPEHKNVKQKNQDLCGIAEYYFESSDKSLYFCTVLDNCLKRARNSQLIIQLAVKQFDEEVAAGEGADEKGYVRTLEELKRFMDAGDPFTDELFQSLESAFKQQLSLLKRVQRREKKLRKKLKSVKAWRMVSRVLFTSALASWLIFSVVAVAIGAPPVIAALTTALLLPIGPLGKLCNSLSTSCRKALKGKKTFFCTMEVGTGFEIEDMNELRRLMRNLKTETEALVNDADIALNLEEDGHAKHAIDDIKKRSEVFMETIEVLCEHAGKYRSDITRARDVNVNNFSKCPNN